MSGGKLNASKQRRREAYFFVLPAFIYVLVVMGYPLIYNAILSFKNVDVKNLKSGASVFVGFQNYVDLFQDETFLLVLKNTFVFTITCLIFQFTIGFAFALFFNQKFKLSGPVRGMILVSYMMPAITECVLHILKRNLTMPARKAIFQYGAGDTSVIQPFRGV